MKKKSICSKKALHFISISDSVINLRDKTGMVIRGDDRYDPSITMSCLSLIHKEVGES